MLSRKDTERMRAAIEQNLVKAIETRGGEVIAVDNETGEEWGHKWREGEARVCVEPEDEDGPSVDYVFAVRVVLVAVET